MENYSEIPNYIKTEERGVKQGQSTMEVVNDTLDWVIMFCKWTSFWFLVSLLSDTMMAHKDTFVSDTPMYFGFVCSVGLLYYTIFRK